MVTETIGDTQKVKCLCVMYCTVQFGTAVCKIKVQVKYQVRN